MLNTDRKTRKIMAMNGCMHTRSNVARLNFPRRDRGRGLIEVEKCVERDNNLLRT